MGSVSTGARVMETHEALKAVLGGYRLKKEGFIYCPNGGNGSRENCWVYRETVTGRNGENLMVPFPDALQIAQSLSFGGEDDLVLPTSSEWGMARERAQQMDIEAGITYEDAGSYERNFLLGSPEHTYSALDFRWIGDDEIILWEDFHLEPQYGEPKGGKQTKLHGLKQEWNLVPVHVPQLKVTVHPSRDLIYCFAGGYDKKTGLPTKLIDTTSQRNLPPPEKRYPVFIIPTGVRIVQRGGTVDQSGNPITNNRYSFDMTNYPSGRRSHELARLRLLSHKENLTISAPQTVTLERS